MPPTLHIFYSFVKDHLALTAHMEKATEKGGQDDFYREGEWAVRLSQHLFSKLMDETPNLDSYKDYKDTLIKRICPCSEQDLIVGNVMEDISFGKFVNIFKHHHLC